MREEANDGRAIVLMRKILLEIVESHSLTQHTLEPNTAESSVNLLLAKPA